MCKSELVCEVKCPRKSNYHIKIWTSVLVFSIYVRLKCCNFLELAIWWWKLNPCLNFWFFSTPTAGVKWSWVSLYIDLVKFHFYYYVNFVGRLLTYYLFLKVHELDLIHNKKLPTVWSSSVVWRAGVFDTQLLRDCHS